MWETLRASPTVLAEPFASDLRFDGGAYAGVLRRKVKPSAAVSRWSYSSVCACMPTGRDLDTGSGCGKVKPQLAVIFLAIAAAVHGAPFRSVHIRHIPARAFRVVGSGAFRSGTATLRESGLFELGRIYSSALPVGM